MAYVYKDQYGFIHAANKVENVGKDPEGFVYPFFEMANQPEVGGYLCVPVAIQFTYML